MFTVFECRSSDTAILTTWCLIVLPMKNMLHPKKKIAKHFYMEIYVQIVSWINSKWNLSKDK